MYKRFLLVIFQIASIITSTFGQLTGTYSIGGINADYSSINSAIGDLTNRGISGTVVFNIRRGTYPGFGVGNISGLVYPDSVIFQSETHDSTDVIINGYVGLSGTGINLKWLTIIETGISSNTAVVIDKCFHCNILNCVINTPNSLGKIYDSHQAVDINHKWEMPLSSVRFENCILIGKGCGFYIHGEKGMTQIINCKINSTGRYSIATWNAQNLSIVDSYIPGTLHMSDATGPLFKGNTVIGYDVDIRNYKLIEGNDFSCLDSFDRMNVEGTALINNRFRQSTTLNATTLKLNTFESDADISRIDNIQFYDNTVYGDFQFVYCDNLHMFRNTMYGGTRLSFADNARVDNNFFYGDLDNGICSNNKIYYNTFPENGIFYSFFPADIKYNNFNSEISVHQQSTIKYNNYYPSGGLWDQHPFRYDPNYTHLPNLIATNPLLMGKGEMVSFITTDKYGGTRPQNPTLGANEICVSSFESKNITLTCGDGLWLKRCDEKKLKSCRWKPSAGLKDSLSEITMAKPLKSTRYYLIDSVGLILDSVMIAVNKFKVEGYDSFYLSSCGWSILLSKNFSPSASYNWWPLNGLSNPNIYNPISTAKVPTRYFQNISIPGCGSFIDSFFLNVNPLPIADAFTGVTYLVVNFENYSSCADSFLWNFGDGQQSKEYAPTHKYDTTGTYNGSMIASNQFGKDTFFFTVKVKYVGIEDKELIAKNILVYPNPTSGLIHIELKKGCEQTTFSVFNPFGQLIYSKLLDSVENLDYVLPQTCGIYVVQFIKADGTHYNFKVIKK